MPERKKYGWSVKGIIGMIFSPMGLFFRVIQQRNRFIAGRENQEQSSP